MIKSRNAIATILAALLVLVGCAGPVSKPERADFLSDYTRLELREDGKINYADASIASYNSFMIDPISILFDRDPDNPTFKDEELESLKQYFVDELTEQLTKDNGYSVATEPGPGVARYRFGFTEVNETIGALNISIYTKVSGLGLGGLSLEGETVDSVTGKQLGAMIRWGSGSRIARAGFTKMGDAKLMINRWTKEFRQSIDEQHGIE